MDPFEFSAYEAALAIKKGKLSPTELIESCLARTQAVEGDVRAWSYIDPDQVREAARTLDPTRDKRPMYGLPFGVKDIIDTTDLPTQYNSPLYQGFKSAKDAACVALLKSECGLVFGKTDTVEFASVGRTAKSRNPHALGHTPGGSSSGSAAAVASGMVPLALGTQTGGSTIRPAAYCGLFGFKPTYGLVSTEGVREYAPSLDTIGWMGRSVDDLILVAQAYGLTRWATPSFPAPSKLRIGLLQTPYWSDAEDSVRRNIQTAIDALSNAGAVVEAVNGDETLRDMNYAQDLIMHGEGRAAYLPEYRGHRKDLHPGLVAEVENAKDITDEQMRWAYDRIGKARPHFEEIFDNVDVCLTPSVPGEAPAGLEETGLATFNRLFTALHVPCMTLPFGTGKTGLPTGIQLIAKRFDDPTLLLVAKTIAEILDVKWALP